MTNAMAPQLEDGALLVAEIGTALTRVALVDLVDDSYRLVARHETWTSMRAPVGDATAAIMEAVAVIEQITGRTLIREGQLLHPMTTEGDGVEGLVVMTSAGGTLPVLVFALGRDLSARSATHAVRSTYTELIRSFALEEAGQAGGGWLNRQIVSLSQTEPHAILVAGGMDRGVQVPLARLAAMARLVAGQQTSAPTIIFAGNPDAAPRVKEVLGAALPVIVVDNLLVADGQARLEPTRTVVRQLYAEQQLGPWLATSGLAQLGVTDVQTVAEAQGLMIRFLHERYGRNILALDMGAASTTALLQSQGHYSEAIFGACGTEGSALDVLRIVGAAAITRWLPTELTPAELENRLLNRRLARAHLPADVDDLLLDHALLREGLRLAYRALRDERPDAPLDLVIAGGAVARAPRPGLAALTILDALELDGANMPLALDLYADSFGLLQASGALAQINLDAAVCLLEQDGLSNGPLATVVIPYGTLQGQVAEVELMPVDGEPLRAVVEAGTLVRLPLARGRRATLRIQPARNVAVGANAPGAEVLSNEAAVVGSALGVIIDARPRPLIFSEDAHERQQMLLGHLRALDALPPPAPTNVPLPPTEKLAPAFQPLGMGKLSGVPAAPRPQPPVPITPVEVVAEPVAVAEENDIQALRNDLVVKAEPQRGGLFRRGKGK